MTETRRRRTTSVPVRNSTTTLLVAVVLVFCCCLRLVCGNITEETKTTTDNHHQQSSQDGHGHDDGHHVDEHHTTTTTNNNHYDDEHHTTTTTTTTTTITNHHDDHHVDEHHSATTTNNKTAACETPEKVESLNEALGKYERCHQQTKTVDLRPLDCDQLKTVSDCLKDYADHAAECFDKDTISSWRMTAKMLADADTYFCSNEGELRREFYREGAISCVSNPDVLACGPNLLDKLVRFNASVTLNKDVLLLKYDADTCKTDHNNSRCYVKKIRETCRSKRVAPILQGLYDVYVNSTVCSGAAASNVFLSSWILIVASLVALYCR